MANTKREKLFTEFPPVPTEKWEEVITADLKGADYERKLVWRTGEGFNVRPYYRAENLEGIRFLGSQAGEFPYVRGTRSHNRWRVHQTVEVKCPKEANAEALKLLNSGVDSLGFSIAKEGFTAEELDQLLAGISIPAIEMTFCGAQTGSIAELVIAKLEKEGVASEAHVAFSIDPLVKGLSQKGDSARQRRKVLREDRLADRKDPRIQAHPHRDRFGRHLLERRIDHRRGAGVRPLGR